VSLDQLDLTTITAAVLLGSGLTSTPGEAAQLALEVSDASAEALKARHREAIEREQRAARGEPEPASSQGLPRLALRKIEPHPTGPTEAYADGWNSALTALAHHRGDEYLRGWNAALEAAERQAS
jgi:hypothetical protein